jgi:hypothetical protein
MIMFLLWFIPMVTNYLFFRWLARGDDPSGYLGADLFFGILFMIFCPVINLAALGIFLLTEMISYWDEWKPKRIPFNRILMAILLTKGKK